MPSDATGGYEGIRRKKRARKRRGPAGDVQSGGGYEIGRQAPKRRRVRVKPPRGDVQTGGGYEVGRQAPKPAPQRAAEVRDVKSRRDLDRAKRYKRRAAYRKSVRQAYDTASIKRRRQILKKSRGREHEILLKVHRDRMNRRREVEKGQAGKDVKSERDLRRGRAESERNIAEARKRIVERRRKTQKAGLFEEAFRRTVGQVLPGGKQALKITGKSAGEILEETTRPTHAVAGGTRAAVRGENVPKAVAKGFANKEKYTFSDVLKEAGVPKGVRGPAGFALDVAADPLTYVTGGVGGVARGAAAKAGRQATKQAVKKGASKPAAKREGARVYKQTLAKEEAKRGEARGLKVKVAGREVPAVRKATAKAAEPIRRVGRTRPAQAIREAASEVSPNVTPPGVKREAFQEARRAARTTRAESVRGRFRAQQEAAAVKRAIPKGEMKRVEEAVERGTVRELPERLRKPAERVVESRKQAEKLRGGKKFKPSPAENLVERHARELDEASEAAAKAKLGKRLHGMGRKVEPAKLKLEANEGLFKMTRGGLQEIKDPKQIEKISRNPSGDYVVLNRKLKQRATQRGSTRPAESIIGRGFDRATGGWKAVVTIPNPGFHARNIVGDIQNAYLLESAPRLAKNLVTSGRALRRLKFQEEAQRTLGKVPKDPGGHVKIQGRKVPLSQLVKEAERVGAIRSGFLSRELPELAAEKVKPGRKFGRRAARALQSREDVVRLATYIGGRKRGLTPEKAADRAMKAHFDYADLSPLERGVFRRIMPFYTFTSRNIPLQAKSFLTKPGKFAQYQKVREEFAKHFGMEDYSADLTEWEKKAAPIPIKWKGKEFSLSMGAAGLPLTDIAAVGNPDEWMRRAMQMINPGFKTPVEFANNFNFFFRDQLERDTGPLVPAPAWVKALPKDAQKKMGVVSDFVDKRTGKKMHAWPAKTDYLTNQFLPGPLGVAERAVKPPKADDAGTAAKILAAGAGVQAKKIVPVTAKLNRLYEDREKLQKDMARWRQRGVNADNPNRQYEALLAKNKKVGAEIDRLKAKRGDKDLKKAKKKDDWTKPGGGSKPDWLKSGEKQADWLKP